MTARSCIFQLVLLLSSVISAEISQKGINSPHVDIEGAKILVADSVLRHIPSNVSEINASHLRNFGAASNGTHVSVVESAIACCFVGQFLRNAKLTEPVRKGLGRGAPAEMKFDAFVSMSTQRDELSSLGTINGETLCGQLVKLGFRQCQADLQEYNSSAFMYSTKHLGLIDSGGIYPHRTASFFSTISRCIRNVAAAESTGQTYTNVIITRLDLYEQVKFRKPPAGFMTAMNAEILGTKNSGRIDDRVMVVSRAYMAPLGKLYDRFVDPSYLRPSHKFKGGPNYSPEIELFAFFQDIQLMSPSLKPPRIIRPTRHSVYLTEFTPNPEKNENGFQLEMREVFKSTGLQDPIPAITSRPDTALPSAGYKLGHSPEINKPKVGTQVYRKAITPHPRANPGAASRKEMTIFFNKLPP
mmetsp:Transcript_66108/g.129603  ORF Transcript_66108/g.129603 Transcript_66108/m.129603 type:complete len:414 (-) Transcript_66108:57-1298(-)